MELKSKSNAAYQGKQFIVDDQPTFIFSGEFHYYRTPYALWEDRLLKCKRMLVNTIASYIPWNWHEKNSGEFDFEGDHDVAQFIDEIKRKELFFIARPGPYICSEWDSGSIPQWVQHDTRFFRTMNPSFLKHVALWYDQINKILVPRLRSKSGNVVIYQIENEDWWCDVEYAQELLKYVRADGIDCPVISNENPKNRGTEIIDTLDDYPLPWQPNSPYMFIPDGMEGKIAKLLKSQPDKPPMHTEFETGWYTEFGQCAPSKWLGDVPAEWIEVLLKSVLANGINALSMYMATGGMNYGYWGSRNCTTDRDWIAPIHGWGELNESFYNIRRFGGMVQTLGPDLVSADVDASLCQNPDAQLSVFGRRGQQSAYIFPRSLSGNSADMHFAVPNVPGYGTIEFPIQGNYHLYGQTMAILPVAVQLHKELPRLVYSTAEIFHLFEDDAFIALMVSGDKGQQVEMAFDGELTISGDCKILPHDRWTVLSVEICSSPKVVRVLNGSKTIQIYFVDKFVAGHTWEFDSNHGSLPLVSNLYLLREDSQKGNVLELNAESRPGTKVWLQMPAAQAPLSATVDGQPLKIEFEADKKIASFEFEVEAKDLIKKSLSRNWSFIKENLNWEDGRAWLPYEKWLGVELHGEYEGGYYLYRTTFLAPNRKTSLNLHLTRFWDEASVFINGQFVDAGRDNLSCDVTGFVNFGAKNELLLMVEDWGHWEHGFAEETGIVSPVVLTSAENAIDLIAWKRFAVGTYPEPWVLDCPQPQALCDFDDSEWKDVLVKKNWDSRIHGTWRAKDYSWYRTKVNVPISFKNKHVRIDFGECRDECWVYVNGKFAKWVNNFRNSGQPFSVDVTDFIVPGQENIIAILVLVKWHGQGGLHQKMQLIACENLANGNWELSKGLYGENNNFTGPNYNDFAWQKINLGGEMEALGSHVIVWLRKKFDLKLPHGWVVPMGLIVRGFEKKANLYINGYFLGRYRSEGPQEKFYIPEPWLKEKNNVLVMMVDGWKNGLKIGEVSLESFPITKQLVIKIETR